MRFVGGCIALLVVLSQLTGCGSSEQQAEIISTVEARGVLTYQGKALENYEVTFHPIEEGKRGASGKTDATGNFTLGSNQEGDGAPPGKYKVTAVFVPPQFQGEPGKEDFSAPPPTPKISIPEKYTRADTTDLEQEIPEAGNTEIKIDIK